MEPSVVATAILVMGMAAAGSVQASSPNTVTAVNQFSVDQQVTQCRVPVRAWHPAHPARRHPHLPGGSAAATIRVPRGRGPAHTVDCEASRRPDDLRQIFNCPVCGAINTAHDPDNNGEPPFNFVVNKGSAGLNQPGDSLLITPDHPVTRARVTASAGTTLRFICAIHPWMQGRLIVE